MANDARIVLSAIDNTRAAFVSAEAGLKRVEGLANSVGLSLGALGAGIALGGLISSFKQAVDALDKLNDAADATGASIESLSKLENVARRNGAGLDLVQTAVLKLNKALASTDEEGKGAAAVLKALGLNAEQLKSLDPAEAIQQVAVAFSQLEGQGDRARVAQQLFGRSVADVAPFLKDLAEAGQLNATVTRQQAEEAERFNKSLFALKTNIGDAGRAIASDMLPWLNQMLSQMAEGTRIAGGFGSALRLFGWGLSPGEPGSQLKELTADLQALQAQRDEMARTKATDVFTGPVDARIADVKKQIEFLKFMQRQVALAGAAELGGDTPGEQARAARPALSLGFDSTKLDAFLGNASVMDEAQRRMAERTKLVKDYAEAVRGLAQDSPQFAKALAALNQGLANIEAKGGKGAAKTSEELERLGRAAEFAERNSDLAGDELKDLAKREAELAKPLGDTLSRLREQARGLRESAETAGLTDDELAALVASQIEEAATLAELNGAYPSQVEQLRAVAEGYRNVAKSAEDKRIADAKLGTATGKLEAQRREMQFFAQAAEQGRISYEEFAEIATSRLGLVAQETERAADSANVFGQLMTSAFEDAIIEGEELREVVQGLGKDIARAALRQGITQPLGNYIAGLFTGSGSAGSGGSGGSGAGSYLNTGSSLFNLGNSSTYMGNLATSFATSSFGSSLGLSSAALPGANVAGITAAGEAIGGSTTVMTTAGEALSTVFSWAPYIAAAVMIISAFMKGSTPHAGAVVFGEEGGSSESPRTLAGFDAFYANRADAAQFYESDFTKRYQKGIADALTPLATGSAGVFNRIARQYGAGGNYTVGVGFSSDDDDKSRGRFSIIDKAGNELTDFARKFSHDPATGMQQFGIAVQQGLLQGLRALDLGAEVNAVLDKSLQGSTDYLTALTEEQTGALLGVLDGGLLDDLFASADLASLSWDDVIKRVQDFARVANLEPLFSALGMSITELGVDVVKAMGGVEQAGSLLSAFYESYYAETERVAIASQDLANEFAELGLEMPESKAAFRDLVESLDLTTEEGRETYASLMRLAPAFATVADSAGNAIAMMADIHNTFAGSIRDVRLSVLDDPGKYAFLDKEGARQKDVLASLTDADLIRDYAIRLNDTITSAWNLLSPEQQQVYAEQFIAKLEEADKLAQERLEAANEAATAKQQAVWDKAAGDIEQAVDAPMQRAVSAIEAAMRAGIRIDLRLPAGFEVG